MRTTAFAFCFLTTLFAFGCDKSGIHPLGQQRDTLGVCTGPTETWLRSTDEGTEVFIIDVFDPEADEAGAAPCFLHGFVEQSTTTRLATGTYAFDETSGTGTFSNSADFTFLYEPDESVIKRKGSQPSLHDPAIDLPFTMSREGEALLLTIGGETRRLTAMADVIDALDETTMEGAPDVFRLMNMPLFTSQARLLGFGGTGMAQYLDITATFVGAIRNSFTVRVETLFSPKTDIIYTDFEEQTGITIDGTQHTSVSLVADGDMRGELTFRMEGRTRMIRGSLIYDALLIRNGIAGGGTYTLVIDGHGEYVLPYTMATGIDLRAVLPVQAP